MGEQKASDLHLRTTQPANVTHQRRLVRADYPALRNDELRRWSTKSPQRKIKSFENVRHRLRIRGPGNCALSREFFQQKYGISAVFRLIPSNVMTVDDLGLPPVLRKFPMLKKGLILVTGPTGSGKSTTLAAMMDYANLQRHDHIITVEDPIEFVHRSQNCLVQHREVGVHTRSFAGPPCAGRYAKIRTSSRR